MSGAITPEHVDVIKSLKMRPNQVNLISEDLNIFERPELATLARAVQAVLDIYAAEVMGISQQLKVTQSWSLINEPGVGMHGHSHSNSVVSGSLYYTDMPEPSPAMVFERHDGYRQLQLDPEQGKTNLFNAPLNAVVPRAGEVILFSSKLTHHVQANTSKERRYSVAFNSFVRGEIGSFKDVSLLKL